jgi:hypothetical protein
MPSLNDLLVVLRRLLGGPAPAPVPVPIPVRVDRHPRRRR